MIQPMTAEEIKKFSGSAYFIVDHTNPDDKCIMSHGDGEGGTMLFKTEVEANDYLMETNPRRSDVFQVVKELF